MSWNCFLSYLLFVFFVIKISQIKGEEWKNEVCYLSKVKEGTDRNKLEAQKEEFPFMVSLQTPKGVHFCSGTLITYLFIVTTAHCIQSFKENDWKPSDMKAVIGTTDRRERTAFPTETGKPKTVFPVVQWIINGCYDKKDSMSDDIALIRLNKTLSEDNNRTQPICLAPRDSEPLRGEVIVAGWGQWAPDFSGEDTKKNKDLKKASVELIHEQQCELYAYFGSVGIFGTIDYGNRLCAKSKHNSICVGDSGGPLFQVLERSNVKNWYLIGIASTPSVGITSKACHESNPVLYLKISHYLNWITDESLKSHKLESPYNGLYDITTECQL